MKHLSVVVQMVKLLKKPKMVLNVQVMFHQIFQNVPLLFGVLVLIQKFVKKMN